MRTIRQIIDYCFGLDANNRSGDPILLTHEEIRLLHDAYAPDRDCDPVAGKSPGEFMGHRILIKYEQMEAQHEQ